jgi:hypothetical protein
MPRARIAVILDGHSLDDGGFLMVVVVVAALGVAGVGRGFLVLLTCGDPDGRALSCPRLGHGRAWLYGAR